MDLLVQVCIIRVLPFHLKM